MPFHNGVYYPFTNEAQGTHSSAGIPSLLSSPLSQLSVNGLSAPAPGMTPSSGVSTFLPFKFRPRREIVDWQRINAVDINLVMSQLDVDALQEHISMVTFCSLDGERCQRCRSPVDPALLKLLQLSQLTVEWLLHCQEFLTLNLQSVEERLAAGDREHKQLLEQQSKQEEKVKVLDDELKQRKKVVRDLQSQLFISSQKCQLCNKAFLTPKFLQTHMQRRHPEDYQSQQRTDTEKKSQIDILKLEISSLREENVQLQQKLQHLTAQEKEQLSSHRDLQRELESFKAEEMARMERKIEDTRDGMRREMETMYNRNIQALNELNQNQIARQETSVDSAQTLINEKLEQQLKKQSKIWESKLQEIKAQYEAKTSHLQDEVSRLSESLSGQQERNQQLQWEMSRLQQENQQSIRAQREQKRKVSSHQPAKIVEVPVVVSAPAPAVEPKPKRVLLEEAVFALNLDPIQELSEEDKDSSSVSERKPAEKRPESVPQKKARLNASTSALKRNPSIKKEMRPELEQALMKKLENLGVKSNQRGLKNKELSSILVKVQSKRDIVAKAMPNYWHCREEIGRTVDKRTRGQIRESASESQAKSRQAVQVLQILPQSSSFPSSATQGTSVSAVRQAKTPQPAPRVKTPLQPKTSTPISKTAQRNFSSKTPPFSSDEESEDDSDMEEEPPPKHQRGKSPQSRTNQAAPVQIKAVKASPVQIRHPVTKQSFSSSPQQPRGSAGVVTKVTKIESDDDEDWSDVSELQDITSKQPQGYRDQNGNVERRNMGKENRITVLTGKIEQKLTDRTTKKPAGGVSILREQRDEVQELTYTDLEESSDWVVSSLEDKQEMPKPAQSSGPVRKSLDSASTSVWGTSTGKNHKSGLTEAGTGSTLKSSLCSLSDYSDSEEVSNKPS